MTPEGIEKNWTFEEALNAVRKKLLEELEEIVTSPNPKYQIPTYVYDHISSGRKVLWSIPLHELINFIGHDLGINHQQLLAVRQELLLEE